MVKWLNQELKLSARAKLWFSVFHDYSVVVFVLLFCLQELKPYIEAATIGGASTVPRDAKNRHTFLVREDNELLVLDGNKRIFVESKDVLDQYLNDNGESTSLLIIELRKNQALFSEFGNALTKIEDKGLILGQPHTLEYLYQQFDKLIPSMKRKHDNYQQSLQAFETFVKLICLRREHRVMTWLRENTRSFQKKEEHEIVSTLFQAAETNLRDMKQKMVICKQKCQKCHYHCLLPQTHQTDKSQSISAEHDCSGNHRCQEYCDYCQSIEQKKEKTNNHCNENDASQQQLENIEKPERARIPCDFASGHEGQHDCRQKDHTCGKQCSLFGRGHCNETCSKESGHSVNDPCMCNSKIHYCNEPCVAANCNNKCTIEYNIKHTKHDCGEKRCLFACQVICRKPQNNIVGKCGQPCHCNNHFHDLEIREGKANIKHHCCDQPHLCGKRCEEKGICDVKMERKFTNAIFKGARGEFEYRAVTEAIPINKGCAKPIPKFEGEHKGSHLCYTGDLKDNKHNCDKTCEACGYYCELPFGHTGLHDTTHGNMVRTELRLYL